jgi:pimeloyl-ACP methyl ester carboxylesterase
MELMHGLSLMGPGFRAFDLSPGGAAGHDRAAGGAAGHDLATEPEGFMVAMDGAVRIHFLDWGGPVATADAGAGEERAADTGAASPGSGDVPGVLLIHGVARTAWSWASIARRLRASAHVVAMDLRGHGLSDAPTAGYDPDQLAEDAIAVAEGTGLLTFARGPAGTRGPGGRPFVIAGHGYGAVVAAWTANALGDRCTGLVLVDGGWTDLPAETGMTPDEWLAAIAEPPEVLSSMSAWLADREAFDPATWGADQERAARTEVVETAAGRVKLAIHRHALAASVGALWTYEPASVLPAVQAQIVALAARDDDAGRHLEALREMAAARSAVGRSPIRAASYPGLGHNLMRHVPDAVAAAIRAAADPRPSAAAHDGRPLDAASDASG